MAVDRSSPLYPEYISECKQLFDETSCQEQEYLNEYPNWVGQDHPNGEKIKALIENRNLQFYKLKKKYGF